MRVGLVCPYSLDVAGGVQQQVLDLAETLRGRGIDARVLAPGRVGHDQSHVTTTGNHAAVRWNGAVARVHWGGAAARATRTWLAGDFDLLHVHEPVTPSVTWHAVLGSSRPVVGTAHTAQSAAAVMRVGAATASRGVISRVTAWTAVSPDAAHTLARYCGATPVLVPNGLEVGSFARGPAPSRSPQRLLFLGRLEEPRKGLAVALRAFALIAERHPEVTLDVAGPGDLMRVAGPLRLPYSVMRRVRALGPVDLPRKAELMAGADLVLAPQLGGESFGIVVAEAMAAGAPVVASDLPAFARLLGHGERGVLVPRGDVVQWATEIDALLLDPTRRHRLGEQAKAGVDHLDWKRVADQLVDVYHAVLT